ncbi:MAG TPA: NAD-dependent epimerase/dehydratase family protein, partial [Candidatus Dormibacteraeota bacterium]|nr:NAD-dependent epimerase/dehydratase family protein [Candidatus Dormibacteraeota bacterium]
MRVVVTGGSGFIGSHVVDALLAAGDDVLVIDDLSTGRLGNLRDALANGLAPSRIVRSSVVDPAAAEAVIRFRPHAVVLLAAQMSVGVSMRDPVLDARVNLLGLLAMLEAARSAGGPRVVFASSGGTIYDPAAQPPYREDAPKAPASFYGLTKWAGVEYLRLYREHRGVDSVALALGNIYGPRQDPAGEAGVVAIFARRLLRGEPCVVNGDGRQTRDYVYVADAVDAVLRSLRWGRGLVNIGSGVETSVLQVHDALSGLVGRRQPPVFGPALPGEVRRVCLDPSLAARELGWRPAVPVEEGARRVL